MSNTPKVTPKNRFHSSLSRCLVWIGLLALTGMTFIIFSDPVQAQTQFGGYGKDDDGPMYSMGVFRIKVAPKYRPLMAGFPPTVYNPVTFRFQSPLMTDNATMVGRSDAFTENTHPPLGADVGTDNYKIEDADIPLYPPGFQGAMPPNRREIHTRVKSFNLTGPFLTAVRAGDLNPTQPLSPGEVQSLDPNGTPALDFPAESFFDVFVEVDLPSNPIFPPPFNVTNMLVNYDPLLVFHTGITEFPPQVVYLHENTTAVPVYVKNSNPPFVAGDLFGHLVLAGHGLDSLAEVDSIRQLTFQNFVNSQPEMPLPCQTNILVYGDMNEDSVVTSADIIKLVNYVFKGGLAPQPCTAAGDVNCSGTVTSADIITLVNFVFKGGSAPCDICADSPLAATCN